MTNIVPTVSEQHASAISRAADWAVTNKFLTALTRFAAPVCIVAVGWAYSTVTTLVAADVSHANRLAVVEQRLNDANAARITLTAELGTARERVAQLATLQQTQTSLNTRLDEFRQDLRDIRNRLDQMNNYSSMPRFPQSNDR